MIHLWRCITVNARISARLHISARFEIAPRLRLKIWNKRPPSYKRFLPLPQEKAKFGTRYDIRDAYDTFNECGIRKNTKLMFFNVARVRKLNKHPGR